MHRHPHVNAQTPWDVRGYLLFVAPAHKLLTDAAGMPPCVLNLSISIVVIPGKITFRANSRVIRSNMRLYTVREDVIGHHRVE